MSQYMAIRRLGAAQAGWYAQVEYLPRVGELLMIGCSPDEHLWDGQHRNVEAETLAHDGPWRVEALVHHYLCAVEAERNPQDAVSVTVLVTPAETHLRALIQLPCPLGGTP